MAKKFKEVDPSAIDQINATLRAWIQIQDRVSEAKQILEAEMSLRRQLVSYCLPNSDEGTSNFKLGDGSILEIAISYDRKLDETVLDTLGPRLAELPTPVAVESFIEYKPKLKTRSYKELTTEAKEIVDSALTVKPQSPQVKLLPAKKESE